MTSPLAYRSFLKSFILAIALVVFSSLLFAPSKAQAAPFCPNQGSNCFYHDLTTDTLFVSYNQMSSVRLFTVSMRIPGYPGYTSGVWVSANVWDPASPNCLAMAPYCNYNMIVNWGRRDAIVQHIATSYPGSKVVKIDFYDANFVLLHTMGFLDPTPV